MGTIAGLVAAIGFVITVFAVVSYDPPSGYNMGTGDSPVFVLFGIVVMVVGLLMLAGGY